MKKSSRHSKLTGDFGEALVLYWLSCTGYECARVDHTGIDLIASNEGGKRRIGISVKSRSRMDGTENESVDIPNDERPKIEDACVSFGCDPHIAIVVHSSTTIRAFLLPLTHFLKLAPPKATRSSWKMTDEAIRQYDSDKTIQCMRFTVNQMDGGQQWAERTSDPGRATE